MTHLVIHYSEIGVKGKNRKSFEELLATNIRRQIGLSVKRRYGKLICKAEEAEPEILKEKLSCIAGIAYFAFAELTELNINKIKNKALDIASKKQFNNFRVVASRSNKRFPLNSLEINREVGGYLAEKLGKEVKLKGAELKIYIEIGEKEAVIYSEKFPGIGGLPVGSSSKVVCSLSGGLDSPVAGFMMMKRGCPVVFTHFYHKPFNKIKVLVKTLARFQPTTKLYAVPFNEIQKAIIISSPAKYRMIVYRRFMMRLLNKIAEKEKAKAIVTGDSVAQVASQTLENLEVIYIASDRIVLTPLIGLNKQEIIELAKRIDSYKVSIQPYADCCSYLVAEHPATKTNINTILDIEAKITGKDKLIERALKDSNLVKL